MFGLPIGPDGALGDGPRMRPGQWHSIVLRWDLAAGRCEVLLDDSPAVKLAQGAPDRQRRQLPAAAFDRGPSRPGGDAGRVGGRGGRRPGRPPAHGRAEPPGRGRLRPLPRLVAGPAHALRRPHSPRAAVRQRPVGRPFRPARISCTIRWRASTDKSLPKGWAIGIADSRDLVNWKKIGEILPEQECEKNGIVNGRIILLDGRLHLFYNTYGNGPKDALCHATSTDGLRFARNPTNPIWSPTGPWNNGRAIDVDVVEWGQELFLYYATRDPAGRIQMLHAIAADRRSGFGRGQWRSLCDGPILKPELPWETRCIEAPSAIKRGETLYLFYGGGYNNDPQQIGCAASTDGIHFHRLFREPLVPNGRPGEWNASESGHPGVFEDDDGRTYLFVQGNNDRGRTWYLSCYEIGWEKGLPVVRWDSPKFPMKRPD